ncbi:YceI family protein [Flavitalea sp. BT771]|uniref:YceI family protein n=1 Tax=Flavitalea sp. BT771 TaxID=3063329 RepID=UPI0026E48C3C|nr:YceI family protein [Flavitalea sp. BT771]MDO6428978.1 YceI family protein [Flavitalea sp. BT771]MDV6218894.1 YceI family protein [Flavitalea sp. BT771]
MKKIMSIALLVASMSACKKNHSQPDNYEVNSATSSIQWKGSATDHFHVGSFDLTGNLTAVGTTVSGGDFTIPISSIADDDLPEPAKQKLLDDLKSANFFNLVVYPQSKFHITAVVPYTGGDTIAIPGANYLVTGDFTMIGETHSQSFPAMITVTGDSIMTEAVFKLDRTKWGMNIYTDPSQALYIYPGVDISLHVRAGKIK